MRKIIRRSLALLTCLLLVGVLCPGPISPAHAAGPDVGDLKMDLDLNMVLASDDIFPASVEGPVWRISGRAGKILVQLPFNITPGSQEVTLGYNTLNVRAGRFICWRVNADDEEKAHGARRETVEAQRGGLEAIPQMTRDITVLPNGKVRYGMERRIPPSGELKVDKDRLYTLKIDFTALSALAPAQPDVSARDAAAQAAVARYRNERNDYNAMRDRVRDLPDKFEINLPTRVWAIFEVNAFEQDLDVDGPPPLPWKISIEGLKSLHEANKLVTAEGAVGGFGGQLPRTAKDRIRDLLVLYETDKHLYTTRMIAYSLHNSAVIPYATRGESLFNLLQLILTSSDDAHSKRVVAKELITTIPPTSESRQLLALAGSDLINADMQFERLRGLVNESDRIQNPAQLQEMVNSANRVLADAAGPPPEEILAELIRGANQNEAMRSALINGMRFNALPDERRDRAIKFVLENAGTSDIAASWLDTQLLGSPDSKLVVRTLEILRSADAGSPVVKPVIDGMLTMVFGAAMVSAEDDQSLPTPKITSPIPISTPRHSFFRSIQHGQSDIRDKAWACLSYFYFPLEDADQTLLQRMNELARSDRYTQLIEAAMNQRPTPVSVVEFLTRQPEIERSTAGLVHITLRGTPRASAAAARALIGARERPLAVVLTDLSYGEREGFGMKMYEHLSQTRPSVLPLLRHRSDRSPILPWFAAQLTEGNLPESSQWVEAFPSPEGMLELVSSADPDLAKAAVIALVASAGGSEQLGESVAQRFASLPDKSLVALRGEWRTVREGVHLARLTELSGSYRLSIVHGSPNSVQLVLDGAPLGQPLEEVSIVTLGVIQMRADQTGVNFGTDRLNTKVMEDEFGIELSNPGEIKRLVEDPRLAPIPLEKATSSCSLRLMPDGSWRGSVGLPSGSAAIVLERVGQ